MPSAPPSLGDLPTAEFRLVREEYPLPKTRPELISWFAATVSAGGIQRVVVELGKPIRVDRFVPADELAVPPVELPSDDVWVAVRNGEIKDLTEHTGAGPGRGAAALVALFDGFWTLTKLHMKAKTLFVSSKSDLRKWLEVGSTFPVDNIMNVDVIEEKEVPKDCVVLAGSSFDQDFPTYLGVRIPVDLPKDNRPPGPPSPPAPPPGRKVA